MKKSKKKLNRKRVVLALILIVIIVLVILICTITILSSSKEESIVNQDLGSTTIDFTEYSTNFENFDEILNNIPMKSITMRSRMQNFAIDFLENVCSLKNSSNDEIEEYYYSKISTIENFLYEPTLDKFKDLVEKISVVSNENSVKFTNCIFYTDSFRITDNEYTFDILICYNNKYNITFTVHVLSGDDINEGNVKFDV